MLPVPKYIKPLRRSLDLSQRFSDLETCLLSQPQNLESLEISQCSSPLLLSTLLSPSTLLPFFLNAGLLPLRLNHTSSCSPRKLLENKRSENELCESDWLTGNCGLGVCWWSVDKSLFSSQYSTPNPMIHCNSTYALVINDFNNSCQFAVGRTTVDKNHTADLYQSPWRCLDLCVTHYDWFWTKKSAKEFVFQAEVGEAYWAICRVCCRLLLKCSWLQNSSRKYSWVL